MVYGTIDGEMMAPKSNMSREKKISLAKRPSDDGERRFPSDVLYVAHSLERRNEMTISRKEKGKKLRLSSV